MRLTRYLASKERDVESAEFLRRMRSAGWERRRVLEEMYGDLLRQTQLACRRGRLYSLQDSGDVLQDVCVSILENWQQFRGDGSLRGWTYRIAQNCVVDYHRRNGRFTTIDWGPENNGGPIIPEPSHRPSPAHEDCVARVLAELNAEGPARAGAVRTIDLIDFIVDCGSDTAQLAAFLGCEENPAKARKSYALMKFRELCVKYCGNEKCEATAELSHG